MEMIGSEICMEPVPSNVDRLAESDARAHDRKWLDVEAPVRTACCSALVEYRWGPLRAGRCRPGRKSYGNNVYGN